jgi:hypothetical protein
MGWAAVWAIFQVKHPVTLVEANLRLLEFTSEALQTV